MYSSKTNYDEDSIDFDFFENGEDIIKKYKNVRNENVSKTGASKIVTKAIIETDRLKLLNISASTNKVKESVSRKTNKNKEMKRMTKIDCNTSSPTSSIEQKLLDDSDMDKSLFNCLAYNECNYEKEDLSYSERECSDNSLSSSTITSVTSNFTSVSPLSSVSDSSCMSSDECVDFPTPQAEESKDGSNISTCPNVNNENLFDTEPLLNVSLSEEECSSKIVASDDLALYAYHVTEKNCTENEIITDSEVSNSSEKESNIAPSVHLLEEELEDASLEPQSSSNSSSFMTQSCRRSSKLRMKKKEGNLTFSREELIKIERDNLILLKKIMAHAKPRSVSLNHSFSHKKTSAAINRARQQKKIEQDNYILYSKISSISRMKKVF